MHPDIYFFNPTCEPAIANGSPYYTAPARLRKFEADLGYLPGWLGEEKDQVLIQGTADKKFEERMSSLGFSLPHFLNLNNAFSDPKWIGQSKGRFFPWGWSPAVYQLFKNVLPSFHENLQLSPVAKWNPEHRNLYSRLTSLNLLGKILKLESVNWMPNSEVLPILCYNLDEVYWAVSKHIKAVIKSPWSSSGRGLLLFPNMDTRKKNDEVLSGMLNQQGFVTVEPWLNKEIDFSYQFLSEKGKISYKGRTIFATDPKGRYVRNYLTDDCVIDSDACQFLEENNDEVVGKLQKLLSQSDYATLYEGWLGVDAIIFKDAEGKLKIHPLIEINGRFTMGAIALRIREYLAYGSKGFMQIYYSKSISFRSFCQDREAKMPLIMQNGKIASGFLPLTPPLRQHAFGAYIVISSSTGCK